MSDPTQPLSEPKEDDWRPNLADLRARLDDIDDRIHALLIERAQVIEDVARSGKAAAFRPGREAAILRRLLRDHTGGLPPLTLVRMWREMLAGTTAMQSPIRVAVWDPTADGAVTAIAREHFGAMTPMPGQESVAAALEAVRGGGAAIAVLPFPKGDAVWWPALTAGGARLHVVRATAVLGRPAGGRAGGGRSGRGGHGAGRVGAGPLVSGVHAGAGPCAAGRCRLHAGRTARPGRRGGRPRRGRRHQAGDA